MAGKKSVPVRRHKRSTPSDLPHKGRARSRGQKRFQSFRTSGRHLPSELRESGGKVPTQSAASSPDVDAKFRW